MSPERPLEPTALLVPSDRAVRLVAVAFALALLGAAVAAAVLATPVHRPYVALAVAVL